MIQEQVLNLNLQGKGRVTEKAYLDTATINLTCKYLQTSKFVSNFLPAETQRLLVFIKNYDKIKAEPSSPHQTFTSSSLQSSTFPFVQPLISSSSQLVISSSSPGTKTPLILDKSYLKSHSSHSSKIHADFSYRLL